MRVTSNARHRARKLRKNMSLPEVLLWRHMRGRNPGKPIFRRQHPIGPYVLDFFCASARLCVEIDGQAHGFGDRPRQDAPRDAFLRAEGIKTLRYSAQTVLEDPYGVARYLLEVAADRSAPSTASRSPSPAGAGEVLE